MKTVITFLITPSLFLMFAIQSCTPKESTSNETASNEVAVQEEPAVISGDFVALFDEESFDGWEGDMDWFRIEESAVVAGSMEKAIPNNEFLCTEVNYENFELRLKAKLQGPGDNAGIQFRSQRIPDHHEVIGYQCDMGSDPSGKIWGYLYDESRRRKFLSEPDNEAMMKVLKVDDWNEFVVRAEGPHIQIWLNGYQTVDFIEEDEQCIYQRRDLLANPFRKTRRGLVQRCGT